MHLTKMVAISGTIALSGGGLGVVQAAPLSPHEEAYRLLEAQPQPDIQAKEAPRRIHPLTPSGQKTFQRDVMGYYSAAHGYPSSTIPYDHLTFLNWFAIEPDATGNIAKTNGWGSSTTLDIVSTAHAAGVKVLVTAVMFDDTSICSLLNSSTARTTLINNLVSQVTTGKADGVSIDFENPTSGCMSNFEVLTRDLASTLHSKNAGWHLSLALPPIDWSNVFHYDVLATYADSLFIMGYGFHYSSSDPGPVDPLYGSTTWGKYALDYSVQDYLASVGGNRDKIILGLPLYGFDWPTVDASVPGDATATAPSIKWKEAQAGAATYGRKWDADADAPYYTYNNGGWHQVWYPDVEDMSLRFDYINAQTLGGVGFWAVGFDQLDPDLWAAVDDAFTTGGSTPPSNTGNLVGYIREGDIYTGPGIPGATVSLNSGQSTTTDSNGFYRFNALPSSVTYTVVASAPCYVTVSSTRLVEAGIDNWKSIALEAGTCPPDSGGSCRMTGLMMEPGHSEGLSGLTLGAMGVGMLGLLRLRRRSR